jgi:hypothetical protein
VQSGLLLAVGAVTLLAAGWMFGKIAEDVVTRDRLIAADAWLAARLHRHAKCRSAIQA